MIEALAQEWRLSEEAANLCRRGGREGGGAKRLPGGSFNNGLAAYFITFIQIVGIPFEYYLNIWNII